MNKHYTEGETYNGQHFTENGLAKGEYENCTFSNCVFSNGNLSEITFSECTFEHCDLSMAKLAGTAFKDVKFKNCKLLGLRFDDCNTFSLALSFENCTLNFSSFFKLKLKHTHFESCKLEEADFVETDLTGSVFKNCDLLNAVFEKTILDLADLRSAYNFSIDPEINRLNKTKFSTQNIAGLLRKYKIIVE
jgi:uncharacterized protein YjbI with pentapeptide repeats